MQAHEGESILSYLLSVYALEKTKPPSGGSQDVFITPVTNKQTNIVFMISLSTFFYFCHNILFTSTNPLGSESRVSPKLVKTMSSSVPVPSLGHLFQKLEYWRPFEALTKKCKNTKHISKILSHG